MWGFYDEQGIDPRGRRVDRAGAGRGAGAGDERADDAAGVDADRRSDAAERCGRDHRADTTRDGHADRPRRARHRLAHPAGSEQFGTAAADHHHRRPVARGHQQPRTADLLSVDQRQRRGQSGGQFGRHDGRAARHQRAVRRQSTRSGFGGDAGPAQRPPRRRAWPHRGGGRRQPDPVRRDRPHRNPEGRRVGHLWHRRDRRRDQLHHAQGLQGHHGQRLHRHHAGGRCADLSAVGDGGFRRPGEPGLQRHGLGQPELERGAARRRPRFRQHQSAQSRAVGGHARHADRDLVPDQSHRRRHRHHAGGHAAGRHHRRDAAARAGVSRHDAARRRRHQHAGPARWCWMRFGAAGLCL